jgi:hypothetical protein
MCAHVHFGTSACIDSIRYDVHTDLRFAQHSRPGACIVARSGRGNRVQAAAQGIHGCRYAHIARVCNCRRLFYLRIVCCIPCFSVHDNIETALRSINMHNDDGLPMIIFHFSFFILHFFIPDTSTTTARRLVQGRLEVLRRHARAHRLARIFGVKKKTSFTQLHFLIPLDLHSFFPHHHAAIVCC